MIAYPTTGATAAETVVWTRMRCENLPCREADTQKGDSQMGQRFGRLAHEIRDCESHVNGKRSIGDLGLSLMIGCSEWNGQSDPAGPGQG